MRVTFTPAQRAFLNHRLEIPDCIAECLPEFSESSVETAARWLREKIRKGFCPSELSKIEAAVLADAVDGSTYCGNVWGTPLIGAAVRVTRATVAKLRAAGFDCPDCPEG